ncbi:MAG: zinc ribbon domain-containing protein [Candidatus Micrarchaeaceae archaeon]
MAVSPQYTTITCNECGNVQEIPLNKRTFICEKCGNKEDRDINASMNILERGILARATEGHSGSQACGDDVRPSARKAVADEAGTIRVARAENNALFCCDIRTAVI